MKTKRYPSLRSFLRNTDGSHLAAVPWVESLQKVVQLPRELKGIESLHPYLLGRAVVWVSGSRPWSAVVSRLAKKEEHKDDITEPNENYFYRFFRGTLDAMIDLHTENGEANITPVLVQLFTALFDSVYDSCDDHPLPVLMGLIQQAFASRGITIAPVHVPSGVLSPELKTENLN